MMKLVKHNSSKTTGYHIFLEPENQLRDKLQNIINTLSTKYSGPHFSPHVTLLAEITGNSDEYVIKKTKELAKEIEPFSISLKGMGTNSVYFQACFLKLIDENLITYYNKKAKKLFSMNNPKEYLPHMSLFYGNITESETEKIISEIQLPNQPLEFEVNKLHIYRTPGTVDTWVKIAEVFI